MIELSILIPYFIACVVIVIVPGPTVTLIIANALRHGSRAGLMNVAGTQAGLFVMIVILAVGLETIVANLSQVFAVLKFVGAAYLIWLGVKLLRSDGRLAAPQPTLPLRSMTGYFWQGVLVIWSNPKVLLFFGAFIPQFVDPSGNTGLQIVVLGTIFMLTATVLDSFYALAAGRTGSLLVRRNVVIIERLSGAFLVAGGLWLAFTRRV
ncbi:MAG: LysE family translocator [Rhizobiales bacterium]|nr:LysE family translocator [Hyphomicrobiales bacterium]